MKIEPNKYYKDYYKGGDYIFYLKTDGDSIYHYISYDRSLHKLKRYEGSMIYFTSITEYNRIYSNVYTILEEISKEQIESDLLLEMI